VAPFQSPPLYDLLKNRGEKEIPFVFLHFAFFLLVLYTFSSIFTSKYGIGWANLETSRHEKAKK